MNYDSSSSHFPFNFVVKNSPISSTICGSCLTRIDKEKISILYGASIFKTQHFHLQCFEPCLDREIITFLDTESSIIFFNLIKNWNSKFFPFDRPYCLNLVQNLKFDIKINDKRLFL